MTLEDIRKNWKNDMLNDVESGIKSWDTMADQFGYNERVTFEENSFLKYLLKKTDLNSEMAVLDVGCGGGVYSFPIAGRAGKVMGIDYSGQMIMAAQKKADELGLKNLEFRQLDWWNCSQDIFSKEYEKKFDLVFAHMTPAIADYDSLMKMCQASRKYCLLSKHARRSDYIEDEIKKMMGISLEKKDEEILYIFNSLWLNGFAPEVTSKKIGWKKKRNLEEARAWYLNRTRGRIDLTEGDEKAITEYLESRAVDGFVEEITQSTLVNIFWQL